MPLARRRLAVVAAAAVLVGVTAAVVTPPSAVAAPDFPVPSSYPISWQLDFTHSKPKRIAVDVPGEATPRAYWYMTYTVTNNGDREQRFYPTLDLVTADGQVHPTDQHVSQRVYDQIKGAERNPRLETFLTINGPVRLGPAEARDGVAVWPETQLRMDHFQVYVSGLSGEAVTLKKGEGGKLVKATTPDLVADAKAVAAGTPSTLTTLRKTLQLNYFIRGDDVYPGEDEVNVDPEDYVMR